MPPTGNKGKSNKLTGGGPRQSRSRNTTPSSSITGMSGVAETKTTSYLHTQMEFLMVPQNLTLEQIMEGDNVASNVPSAAKLKDMEKQITDSVMEHVRRRGEICDRGMRELVRRRKDRIELEREQERAGREEQDRREKAKKVQKKIKREKEEERPLAVGAHGVARQDGVDLHKDESSTISSPSSQAGGAGPDAKFGAGSPSISESSHQPPPAPSVPQYQTFGPDPSTFDDPTIYDIRDLTPDMTEEERKEILCVAQYPPDDLYDKTCGTPPDRDFSNAKPASQVTWAAFSNYVEPYLRPFQEEDIAFLKERGDRITPFVMPRRGPKHYKDLWAEEDGIIGVGEGAYTKDNSEANEPMGSIDVMDDEAAEMNTISGGPMFARLLSALRPEGRVDNGATETNGDMEIDGEPSNNQNGDKPLPPAAFMPESTQPSWKAPSQNVDFSQMDDRIKAELRHIGILQEEEEPDYDAHYDDEVAARIRYLQSELKRVCLLNAARKARVLELASAAMASQEYSTIADDLDNQLNQAFSKRNRTMTKGKKNVKRPGAAGAHVAAPSGVSKPGVGEPIRSLMERRVQWQGVVGPVVDYGHQRIPRNTIFEEETMKKLQAVEQEKWDAEQE